jgi:hypothetical protein
MLEGGRNGLVENITAVAEQLVEEDRKATFNARVAEHRDRRVGITRSTWKISGFGHVPETIGLQPPRGIRGGLALA